MHDTCQDEQICINILCSILNLKLKFQQVFFSKVNILFYQNKRTKKKSKNGEQKINNRKKLASQITRQQKKSTKKSFQANNDQKQLPGRKKKRFNL